MSEKMPLVFKIASEDWEFEAIHHLNYKTFVEEIPQHAPSPSQRLVDKFHTGNTYLTCFSGRKLAGMLAVRGQRPFSLDQKLENLDSYLPAGRKICEVRLLAIEKKYRGARGGQLLAGLLALLWQHGVEQGYDLAVISGTTRQEKLYRHLGFIPFGPLVGTGDALFQPMFITMETFEASAREFLRTSPTRAFQPMAANFLPGPVAIHRLVKRAFEQTPESHRGDAFVADFQATKKLLCELTNASHVEILLGSGSLANDAVAAQLSLESGRGLILTNGEFGERLVDHARRMKLEFDTLKFGWGETFDYAAVDSAIRNPQSAIRWLWFVHCETSTGVLNDLDALKKICAPRGVKLCLDAISSIGTVPVDLRACSSPPAPAARACGLIPACPSFFIIIRSRPHRVSRVTSTSASMPVIRALPSHILPISCMRCARRFSEPGGKNTLPPSPKCPRTCAGGCANWASI